jgi:hypothetical protein
MPYIDGMQTIEIGTWHETQTREFSHCPSYYAADTETLRVKVGAYSVRLSFEGGYTIPMPYWLLIGIDTDRIDGRLYSGFGGLNFASTELPKAPVRYTIQMYAYQLAELVKDGRITLKPGFEWMVEGECMWQHPSAPKTWDDVKALQ